MADQLFTLIVVILKMKETLFSESKFGVLYNLGASDEKYKIVNKVNWLWSCCSFELSVAIILVDDILYCYKSVLVDDVL